MYSSVVERYWVMLVTIVVCGVLSGVNGVALVIGEESGSEETQGWMKSTASSSCCCCSECT